MGKEKLSHHIFLFMAGLNAFIGVAAARLDIMYLFAGLGTCALFYYLRNVLNSGKESTTWHLNNASKGAKVGSFL